MDTKKTAMVSSTSIDLPAHRKQVMEACERLGLFPSAMEHLPARDADAIQVSLEMVDKADVYIGVYAWRYGHIPEGHEVSITEMEFDRAVERGIPILVFTIHDDHLLHRSMVETRPGAQEKLAALKDKACNKRGRAEFKSPEDLRGLVLHALHDLQQREQAGAAPAPQFHALSHIPQAPEPYIAHPYTLLQSKDLVGRQAELNLLTDWVTANRQVPAQIRLFNVVALGGMGKSALTWKWFNVIAPLEMPRLAGRLWWSFYESDAHYENFVIRALAYVAELPEAESRKLPPFEREERLLRGLDERPFLLVLDGLERVLLAYARMDAAHLADDDLDERAANVIAAAHGLPDAVKETYLAKHRLRQCADPRAGRFLRRLAQVRASRIVVSTRLYPAELQTQAALPLPACFAVFLNGLADDDALNLWREFGVSGAREALLPLFNAFGNYPLLLRALAGEVAEYRAAPGDFGRWRAGNPGFDPASQLDLRNAKTHVLQYALQGLGEAQRKVLRTLAAFRMPAGWETVKALLAVENPSLEGGGGAGNDDDCARPQALLGDAAGEAPALQATGSQSFPGLVPKRELGNQREPEEALDRILTELEDRGLVGWDRRANRYDLHPIVRGVVWAALDSPARKAIYGQLHGYFDAAPKPPDWEEVESLEELTPAIELYHTLIGLERYDEAITVFRDHLEYATLYRLSASRPRREWLERLFPDGLEAQPRLASARTRSRTLNALALACQLSGEPGRAGQIFQRKVEIDEAEQDEGNVAVGLENLSDALRYCGQLRAAETAALRALLIGRKREDRFREGVSLQFVGLALAACGNFGLAETALCRSVAICIAQKNQQGEGLRNAHLAQHRIWQDHTAAALPLARRAWELAQVRRHERDCIRAARLHGQAALGLDDFDTAEERLHHALSRARAVNLVEEELPALTSLAELHRRRQQDDEARESLEPVWDAAERGPYPLLHADARNVLAQIERDQGHPKAAIAAAIRAYELAWCDGPPYAYHFGLANARRHLQALGVPEPHLPPFDESRHEPMPEVELNPRDEFYAAVNEE